MKFNLTKLLALGGILFLFTQNSFVRADYMNERIHKAIRILKEKQHSDEPIPAELLNHARGIAIFTLTKAGLGIGGQGGEGIIIVRLGDGISHSWTAPSAINLAGASIGAQIGFTDVRYIVVLNTGDAVRHFSGSDKVTWNGTATGTAGEDTVTEKIATADLEHREIVIYKDSAGVFGGATLGGTTIEHKSEINRAAYGENVHTKDILNGTVPAPQSAARLYALLDSRN